MNQTPNSKHWRSPAAREAGQLGTAADLPMERGSSVSRRQFLEAAGFTLSLAAISGCGRAPVETALPFALQPEGVVPGRMQSYASTCAGCSAGCGLLVGVRDGRPLKMEGMSEHPLSRGGLCAIGQALPLGLYDSHRLAHPLADGKEADWETIDRSIVKQLPGLADRGAIVMVTSTVTSPTLQTAINSFLDAFQDSRHVVFDGISCSAILDSHERTHGGRVLPHYRFDRAKVIVSFGADFLGTWISPVEFTTGWRSHRAPSGIHHEMSYHVQFEGRMSLTGSNADRRYRLSPDQYAAVLGQLAQRIAELANQTPPEDLAPTVSPLPASNVTDLAQRLWDSRGVSLVVSDSQDSAAQVLVNYINHLLGNYGNTLNIEQPSRQKQGNDADIAKLIEDVHAEKVAGLFVAGTDFTHNLPNREGLREAINKIPLVVSFAERLDDFGELAHYVCPDHHPLESWLDSEAIAGVVSLSQPTLHSLGKTRSILETLHRWRGGNDSAYEFVREVWKDQIYPRAKTERTFQEFWDQAVHDGFVHVEPPQLDISDFQLQKVVLPEALNSGNGFSLSLYFKVGMTDSRHAHNPWLQELPDPVTKVTWDNYVSVSEATAKEHDLVDGDLVRVTVGNGKHIELPAFIQPGQHDQVLSIALGYGVAGTERFAKIGPQWLEARPTVGKGQRVGKNAADFLEFKNGLLQCTQSNVTLEKIRGRHELASTQQHHSLEVPPSVAPHGAEVRDIVQETTLNAFAEDPQAGTPEVHHHGDDQLWAEDHHKTGHHWGMTVDLNCCTGCSACLIACQAENNVPVVGKDEVRRQREMHWIRVDRYYSGDDDDINAAHQPMMCQHCDNAPCETVCPVLATVHGEEGLNEQAYNRCVGTRYCANNCPYKVRRFNWFEYERDDELQNLVLNPDVTVRSRGVMEKCSMCVQRIEDGKLEAKRRDEPLEDGAIQTACQQSCPAQAIIFGDMNDPNSRIHQAMENPRRYGVLEEFNFRSSVSYLRVVRNRDDHEPVSDDSRVDGHEGEDVDHA